MGMLGMSGFTKRHEDTHRKDSTSLWVKFKKIAKNNMLKKHWFHAFLVKT